MINQKAAVHFIDDYVKANTQYLNNLSLARLEFLSLWLQSHPDTSRMDEKDRYDLCNLLQTMVDSGFFTDKATIAWLQIKCCLEADRKNVPLWGTES